MSSAPNVLDALPLESGDRLSRAEFEARYAAWADPKKAELVEGVVYVSSPVKRVHSLPDGLYITWLSIYAARTPPLEALPNATVRLDGENEPQPDSLLYWPGRSARVDDDGYLTGAPDRRTLSLVRTRPWSAHEAPATGSGGRGRAPCPPQPWRRRTTETAPRVTWSSLRRSAPFSSVSSGRIRRRSTSPSAHESCS